MVLILVAYYFVSTKKVSGQAYIYQLLNFFGALGIIWNTFVQRAWPAMMLNVVWAVIAIVIILSVKKSSSNAKRI